MFAHLARARGGAERGRRRLAAQLRGRGRRPPDRTSMMMADYHVCASRARARRSRARPPPVGGAATGSRSPGLPCLRISRAREAEPSAAAAGWRRSYGAAAAGWRRSYGVEVDDRLIAPPSDVCSLQDSGLARWCSLSLSAWLPSAAPDHGRAAAADFFFANLGGGAAAAGLVGDGATGSTATTAGSRQHDDGQG